LFGFFLGSSLAFYRFSPVDGQINDKFLKPFVAIDSREGKFNLVIVLLCPLDDLTFEIDGGLDDVIYIKVGKDTGKDKMLW